MKTHYDVVVVGSGYGGCVSAFRMAEAGYSVCLLERGQEYHADDFPDTGYSALKSLHIGTSKFDFGNDQALLDFRWGKNIHVLLANGLGGGSLINAAVALRPDEHLFEDDCWPEALRNSDRLREAFTIAEDMLEVNTCPTAKTFKKYTALERCGKAFDAPITPLPMAIAFENKKNQFGFPLNACQGCGDCWVGCKSGSKNSLDKNYIPAAMAYGAEVFTGCLVETIAKSDDGDWEIILQNSDEKKKRKRQKITIKADKVILAAGSLGSTEILLRSVEKGLSISGTLGANFSGNGDYIAYGYKGREEVNAIGTGIENRHKTDSAVGPSATGMIQLNHSEDEACHKFVIQDGTFLSILRKTLIPMNFLRGDFRDGFVNIMKGVYQGTYKNMQTYYVISQDDAGGQMVLEKDRLKINWEGILDQPAYRDVDSVLEKMAKANEGRYETDPMIDGKLLGRRPVTAHPLGGCVMGDHFRHGVVNHKCEVFDGSQDGIGVHEGLYVCDGSIIPLSLGLNPLLTITALAEYAMSYIDLKSKQ